jgi:hypothetical protein
MTEKSRDDGKKAGVTKNKARMTSLHAEDERNQTAT